MKLKVILPCLSLCLVAAHAVAHADATADLRRAANMVQRGDKAFKSGDPDKARKMFQDALEVVPDFPDARMGLGHLAMQEGRIEAALQEYTIARDAYASFGELMRSYQAEKYSAAQLEIRRLEDEIRTINDPRLLITDTTRAMKTLQLENAIEKLRALTPPSEEKVPQPPAEVYFHLGNALFRLNRHDEAVEVWKTCAERNPQFALVHNNLAVAYMMQGRFDEARQSIATAEQLGMTVSPDLKADLERRAGSR